MTKTESIQVNDFAFTVETAGPVNGELVIFLHGFPNSRHSWLEQLRSVAAAGYRGLAPDQRGYSPGARPDGISAYHVDEIVSDVISLADAVGANQFHLVGHDWGGQIAWLTAIADPDRLKSLTVLSRPHPAAFAKAFEADPAQANRSRHHKAFQDAGMADRLLADGAKSLRNTLVYENASGLFGKNDDTPRKRRMSDDQAKLHLSVIGNRGALDAALNWYRAAFNGQSTLARADAPAITMPTLYFWGTDDLSVGRIAAENTGEFIDAPYEFKEIADAGHFLAEEIPDVVGGALLDHIEKHN